MIWIVVQLSVWARNRLPVEEINAAIANVLVQNPLYIYIPVYEDPFGKKDTGFGEYAFINYDPDEDYYVLEALDEVVRVLKEPFTKKLQFLTNEEVWEIKRKSDKEIELNKDDVVRVIAGPLRSNYGVVQFVVGDNVNVMVNVGQESLQVTLPLQHVRKSPRRTLGRKKETRSSHFNLVVENGHSHQPKLNFGEIPRIQILRRGLRKTRVAIDNKVYQIANETIDKILLSSDILDEKLIDEMSKVAINEDPVNGFDSTF